MEELAKPFSFATLSRQTRLARICQIFSRCTSCTCKYYPQSLLHLREFQTHLLYMPNFRNPIPLWRFCEKSGQYGNFLSRYFLSFCSCTPLSINRCKDDRIILLQPKQLDFFQVQQRIFISLVKRQSLCILI